jgi:hypothetical protein
MEKLELVDGVRLGCGGMRSGETYVFRGSPLRDGGGDCDVE